MSAKSASYTECLACSTSFLLPHAPSRSAARKMIRWRRPMGGRHRNSTSAPAPRRAGLETATPENAVQIAALLAAKWPDAVCELDHQNAYQLLVATILSAQSTDKMINTITPALFAKYPDA